MTTLLREACALALVDPADAESTAAPRGSTFGFLQTPEQCRQLGRVGFREIAYLERRKENDNAPVATVTQLIEKPSPSATPEEHAESKG